MHCQDVHIDGFNKVVTTGLKMAAQVSSHNGESDVPNVVIRDCLCAAFLDDMNDEGMRLPGIIFGREHGLIEDGSSGLEEAMKGSSIAAEGAEVGAGPGRKCACKTCQGAMLKSVHFRTRWVPSNKDQMRIKKFIADFERLLGLDGNC
jgi:hypothetical protein